VVRPRCAARTLAGELIMFWQETQEEVRAVPDDVVDIVYQINCRALPVDHAWALSQAVRTVLPWLEEEPTAGVHPIHVADSGNGWMRPENADDLLCLSRRTKLVLRVPRARIDAAQTLVGKQLDVAGHALHVDKATLRPLSSITTIFSRYVVSAEGLDETAFLQAALQEMAALGVRPKKMLCGIEKVIATPSQSVHTRSLMLAELNQQESVTLQQHGLGPLRHLGCGLFIPHKDIKDLKQALE
jgi:CRISPR-associated protein Cas6